MKENRVRFNLEKSMDSPQVSFDMREKASLLQRVPSDWFRFIRNELDRDCHLPQETASPPSTTVSFVLDVDFQVSRYRNIPDQKLKLHSKTNVEFRTFLKQLCLCRQIGNVMY